LLEVMAAVGILGLTLVVLLDIITKNVRATTRARMTTTATFLARGKMVSLEDTIIEKGFQDLNEVKTGNFAEEGFPEFSWESNIEKIQLPIDLAQKTQQETTSKSTQSGTGTTKDPMQALTGMVGGMMGMFIEPVRVGLEESIRRVTLRVFWTERSRGEQSVELVLYVTDPARLDMALSLGAAAAGAPGAPGTPGTPGGPPPSITPGGGQRP
jgi:general secretion pathway protein I